MDKNSLACQVSVGKRTTLQILLKISKPHPIMARIITIILHLNRDTAVTGEKSEWVIIYLIAASSLRFTSSQFTMFQKASTNLALSFL